MSLRQIGFPWTTDVINTTDATPTVSAACSYVVPSGGFGICMCTALIKASATFAFAQLVFPFRNIAGTLTLLTTASPLAVQGDAGLLTAVLDVTKSGTTIQPRVTGIVATNLEWTLDCYYRVG